MPHRDSNERRSTSTESSWRAGKTATVRTNARWIIGGGVKAGGTRCTSVHRVRSPGFSRFFHVHEKRPPEDRTTSAGLRTRPRPQWSRLAWYSPTQPMNGTCNWRGTSLSPPGSTGPAGQAQIPREGWLRSPSAAARPAGDRFISPLCANHDYCIAHRGFFR